MSCWRASCPSRARRPWRSPSTGPPPKREDGRRKRIIVGALTAALVAAAVVLLLLLAGPAKRVAVPDVRGRSEQAAVTRLRLAGFSPVATQGTSASAPIGFVFAQSPSAGTKAHKGGRVTITVSSGPGSAAIPSVAGLAPARAAARL